MKRGRKPRFEITRTGIEKHPWRINVPSDFSPDGKRQRLFFRTQKEAKVKRQQLLNRLEESGIKVRSVEDYLIRDAVTAQGLLAKAGFEKVTLADITRAWIKTQGQRSRSVTLAEMIASYITELEDGGRRERYLEMFHQMARRLDPVIGEVLVCDVTHGQLAEAFEAAKLSGNAWNNYRARMRAAFNFARARDWCTDNPAETMPLAKTRKREIKVLTNGQVKALIEATDDQTRAYFALGIFCGIRPDELSRLDWSDVNMEERHVLISRGTSKTDKERLVTISDNLAAILEPLQQPEGCIHPKVNWRKISEATRKQAGVFDDWQQDIMRHTFASNHAAFHKDHGLLMGEMGHDEAKTLGDHYRKGIPLKQAIAFWKIGLTSEKRSRKSA